MDITRALLLPDVFAPSDSLLKTLALYWDDLVLLDYQERLLDEPEFQEPRGETHAALAEAGLLHLEPRTLDPGPTPEWLKAKTLAIAEALQPVLSPEARQLLERVTRGEAGDDRPQYIMAPGHALRLSRSGPRAGRAEEDLLWPQLKEASRHLLEATFQEAHDHYLARVDDACSLAAVNAWGPVASSAVASVAAALGPEADALPMRGVALLSIAADAFAVAPETPVDNVLRFRDRHAKSMRRLRASLVDLSASLGAAGPPSRRLSEARSTFMDRVTPALGDLEAALAESKVRFVLRSLLGSVTLALPPLEPVSTVTGGIRMTADVLDYRFSRAQLTDRHPFGYLHHITDELGFRTASGAAELLVETQRQPREVLHTLFYRDAQALRGAVQRIWGWDLTGQRRS